MNKDTPLRIGLVGPLPPPFGGMANQTLELQTYLQAEGFHVSLVQTNPAYRPRVIEKFKRVRAFFRLVPYLLQLWKLAREVDVIHVLANSGWSWQLFAAPAVWVGRLRGRPVIVNYRGGEARSYFERAFKRIRPTMVKGDALIVPSGYLEKVFADFGLKTEIIPNIINRDRFRTASRPKRADPASPHVIVTRNLEKIYDIPSAIKAISLLRAAFPTIRLTVAGSGPEKQVLKRLVEDHELEGNVVFTGKLSPDEMAKLYRRADVMLSPSTVDNMPNSVLESLASGVPVVATNVGGVPYVVEDEETALLVEVGDAMGMAKQIERLLTDSELYANLVENGLESVRQYACPVVGQQWLHLYRNLVSSRYAKSGALPKLLVFSSLFPHEGAPNLGLFIRERMFRVGQTLPLVVVSPQPWFPGQGLLRYLRPYYRPDAPHQEIQQGITVYFPRFLSVPLILKRFDGIFMALGSLNCLRRIRKEFDFDIIDSHFAYPDGYAATLLGRWLHKPVTITLRGTEVPLSRISPRKNLIRESLDRADRVFSVSESLKRHALTLGADEGKFRVVGNGVDIDKFHPLDKHQVRTQLGVPLDARVLISVGALVERKGFHRVIEILPELKKHTPNLKFLIVGGPGPEGDHTQSLKKQVTEKGLEGTVEFLGQIPSEELNIPLSASDVFVLATGNEGWANVFLEAMACGLPVVTTRVGGNAEVVVNDEYGTLVPYGDSRALTLALKEALDKNWDRDKIIQYAKNNSWGKRVSILVRTFNDIAGLAQEEQQNLDDG